MKYIVKNRNDWNEKNREQFGEPNSVHELTDAEVVKAIIDNYRAVIQEEPDGTRTLEFQPDYD